MAPRRVFCPLRDVKEVENVSSVTTIAEDAKEENTNLFIQELMGKENVPQKGIMLGVLNFKILFIFLFKVKKNVTFTVTVSEKVLEEKLFINRHTNAFIKEAFDIKNSEKKEGRKEKDVPSTNEKEAKVFLVISLNF